MELILDALEPLLQRDTDILKPTDYNYTISFIGAALDITNDTVDCIKSINRIGEELGRDFELVVVHNPVSTDNQEILRTLRKSMSNLVLLESHIQTIGQGKKIAFEYTTGKFIVPFDATTSYPINYSDLLHNFLRFKLKRLYFSELSLMSREIVQEVGNWRNLSSGEDIDLYSRLAINYGVFACPTNIIPGSDNVSRKLLSIRNFPETAGNDFSMAYNSLKDLIISCNHSYSDISGIFRSLSKSEESPRGYLAFFSYVGSRFSHVKPISYNRNNYVILMEAILESLILREYLKMTDVKDRVSWHIDRPHKLFLKSKSKLFREMEDSTTLFIQKED